jgi:ferredoxin-type protein NapH
VIQHYAVIGQVPFFLLGLLGLFGLLVGRMACGWLCPFGLVQDLLYRIKSHKIQIPALFFPLRYLVLAILVLLLPGLTGESWFSILCPQGTLTAAIPWALWNPKDPVTGLPMIADGSLGSMFAIKVIILLGFLALFVVAKRPFCRVVCPLGLIFSFFNKHSLVKLEVSGRCSRCDQCQKDCPVDIKVYEEPNAPACIRCLKCTDCKHVKLKALPLLPASVRPGVFIEKEGQTACTPKS